MGLLFNSRLEVSAESKEYHNLLTKVCRVDLKMDDTSSFTNSKRYLVEFKGILPSMRMMELLDSLAYYFRKVNYCISDESKLFNLLNYQPLIEDITASSNITNDMYSGSICGLITLPDDGSARLIASRCALVRSIIEVWGDGYTINETYKMAERNFDEVIRPIFPPIDGPNKTSNSWRVKFRRFGRSGRSGLDPAGKRALLLQFNSILRRLNGEVDLLHPSHDLVYLEDWHSYQHTLNLEVALSSQKKNKTNSLTTNNTSLEYSSMRNILGRIVASGPNILTDFSLKERPFVGTTTMNPVSAHLTAAAALVGKGDLVLDPFCGTASLLIAAANLGADVVGSDVDVESLFPTVLPDGSSRSKNGNFRRKDGSQQLDRTAEDNFDFYGLRSRLLDLFGADVAEWMHGGGGETVNKYQKFDAIICDPPFGIREKLTSPPAAAISVSGVATSPVKANELLNDGEKEEGIKKQLLLSLDEQVASLTILFQVAAHRLTCRSNNNSRSRSRGEISDSGTDSTTRAGRLVLWLPTAAGTTPEQVFSSLQKLTFITSGVNRSPQLKVLRVRPEELNDNLWRWLCVLERVEE